MGFADQAANKLVIPVGKTAPTSGKAMYSSYCAPCHGIDGRGRGPAASALRTPPTDLTTLSRNNRGRFPDTHVVTVLLYGTEIPTRRTAEMPTWGPILGKMNQSNPQDRLLRISNLSRYLEAIQVR
jgi:mono/diheme cytochrome c family protein